MRECSIAAELLALRRELAWGGLQLNEFHATADRQWVRDRVFEIIAQHDLRFDATVYEKQRAYPYTYADPLSFYKLAWYAHFKHVAPKIATAKDELLVVASSLRITRKKKIAKAAVHEAVKDVVNLVSPTVVCHCAFSPTKSDPCLQVADYLSWAIQRKNEIHDDRPYERIKHLVASERHYFRYGTKNYF